MLTDSRPLFPKTSAIALTACLLALLAWLVAAPAANAGGGKLDKALDKVIDDPMGPPGLSVIVQRGNRIDFRRRGVADRKTGAKPRIDSPMRIASMAKAFNGAVVLSLVSKGELEPRRHDRRLAARRLAARRRRSRSGSCSPTREGSPTTSASRRSSMS